MDQEKLNKITLEAIKILDIQLLPSINNRFDDINSGGCGVFAWLLWKKLLEWGIQDIECLVLIDEDENPIHTEDYFRQVNSGGDPYTLNTEYGFNHMVLSVYYNGAYYIIDCDGIEKTKSIATESRIPGEFIFDGVIGPTLDFNSLELLANNTKEGLWNPEFNRNEIPIIKKIMDECQLPKF